MISSTSSARVAERAPEVFFLPQGQGQRLCIYRASAGPACLGAVVHVHAFGEEMNKSRRMCALQARALAEAGYAVLQIDLAGCGDSSGDSADATWDDWAADVQAACLWLRAEVGKVGNTRELPLWLWGVRAGCLVALAAAKRLSPPWNLLFWQAPASGQVLLQQFLRLKAAGNMVDGQAKVVLDGLRQALSAGQNIEVAGYGVSAALANGLAAATMAPPSPAGRVEWIELSTRAEAALSPVVTQMIETWRAAGWQAQGRVVSGPAFWQTTEIEDAPALLPVTVAALSDGPRAQAATSP